MIDNEVSLEITQEDSGEMAVIDRRGRVLFYAWHGEWRRTDFPNERLVDLVKRAMKVFKSEFSQEKGAT